MSTIVTAFMTNVNEIDFRGLDTYMTYGKLLLSQAIPTVCFLEKEVYDHFFSIDLEKYPNTKFIFFEKGENYLSSYEPELTEFYVNTDNPKKDTPGYMFIQCHKTEWIRMAIEENPFQTQNFMWVDFGIYHMIRDEMDFAICLKQSTTKKYGSVRIASCRNINEKYEKDIYKDVAWYFAGSVFGGKAELLLLFADKMKEKCIELMTKKHHLMWEINIWYLLYHENPTLFELYHCNHNKTILEHY